MTDVGLHRSNAAIPGVRGGFAEGLGEGGHFDGIAQKRAGPMAFHVVDGVGTYIRYCLRLSNGFCLTIDTGCEVAGFGRAVVVDRRAFDHGPYVVAVFEGIFQATQHHGASA